MTLKFTPLGNYVLIQPTKADEKTKGGLFIPEAAQERPRQGKVLSVGEGALTSNGELIPPKVKRDDIVIFPPYAGTEIKLGEEKYMLIRETDLLGTVEL